jgi:hypothetical protein
MGPSLFYIYEDQDHQRGERILVRVVTYTFTDSRIPGAGKQTYRLVTTLLDPFLYPSKELAVLYHERWHVEGVIDETRTHLRLSARTLRSLTPEGVVQEIYALVLAHTVIRTLMLKAAEQAHIAPTQISFTETIRVMDENLVPLSLVTTPRRQYMVLGVIKEIGEQRLPKQPIRIQPRVVKRAKSRYDRKKPEHLQVPALELDVEFYEIIAVVPCIQGLASVPEMPLLPMEKETPAKVEGDTTRGLGRRETPACQPKPDLPDTSSPSADTSSFPAAPTGASSSPGKRVIGNTTRAREHASKTECFKTTRAP